MRMMHQLQSDIIIVIVDHLMMTCLWMCVFTRTDDYFCHLNRRFCRRRSLREISVQSVCRIATSSPDKTTSEMKRISFKDDANPSRDMELEWWKSRTSCLERSQLERICFLLMNRIDRDLRVSSHVKVWWSMIFSSSRPHVLLCYV